MRPTETAAASGACCCCRCLGYADAALGKADSLLVPRATPLPQRPFERVPLAHLPEPIGSDPSKPSLITVYDTRRRTVCTLGVYHSKGREGYQFSLCL